MTTPRDFRAHQTSLPPAFVEFDMSAEGFGGLYIPSIAPQGVSGGSAIVGATLNAGLDTNITGGIGSGRTQIAIDSILSSLSILWTVGLISVYFYTFCHRGPYFPASNWYHLFHLDLRR